MRRPSHFNVRPRYGGGSPAAVKLHTAQSVAASEMRSYADALEGVYGEALQARAKRLGLRGIAEGVRETRKGWEVIDLCTSETYIRPFDDRMRKQGWKQWQDLTPGIQKLVEKVEPVMAKEASKDSRIIWFRDVDVPDFWANTKGAWEPTIPDKLVWEPEVKEAYSS